METNSPNIQDSFDDLFEHFSFIADVGQNPLRVDKFLMNRIENATRNKIQQAAKEGLICLLYTSPSPRDQRGSRRAEEGC